MDIGPKPMRLRFTPEGGMLTSPSQLLEHPLPAILDMPGWPLQSEHLTAARATAAKKLDSVAVMPVAEAAELALELFPFVVPVVDADDIERYHDLLAGVRMAQVMDGPAPTRPRRLPGSRPPTRR